MASLAGLRLYGLSFRRQQPVGPYVLDFYCSVARLAIELDGDAHACRAEADGIRQRFMEEQGVSVLRFPNSEVMHNMPTVLNLILDHCQAHLVDTQI